MSTMVGADLEWSVTVGGRQMTGALRGAGSDLVLTLSDPKLLGGTGTGPARSLARQLAQRGILLRVVTDQPLVTLGVPKASRLQRWITGSPHIVLASPGAALRILRLRRRGRSAATLVPPATPTPLAPTLLRRRRVPTTTHDETRGGYPRLVMAPLPGAREADRRTVFLLQAVTTIGSAPECDIRLPGTEDLHAEIRHTEDDEFVLTRRSRTLPVRVNGGSVDAAMLRTGTRVEIGPWTFSYAREEYADHGRPHGGRIGGELGRQRPQPPRPRKPVA
jgi:hypothetical protein